MGFPASYSDIALPGALLRLLVLMGYVRGFIFCLLRAFGLGGFLDIYTEEATWSEATSQYNYSFESSGSKLPFISARRIQDSLPVVRYMDLLAEEPRACGGDDCAVCLCELEGEDEVRRLINCCHVFHRGCLDRWTEHEQSTCPLCRTPLVDGLPESSSGELWSPDGDDVAAVDYEFNELYSFFTLTASSALVPPQSPTLLLNGQFL